MDQRDQQLHTRSRTYMGMLLILLWITAVAATLWLSVGITFARFQSTGTANVTFTATGKPQVTVTEIAAVDTVEDGTRTFNVTCSHQTEQTGIRIRLYSSGKVAQTVKVQNNNDLTVAYTVIPRALDSASALGQTGEKWVYMLTDESGQELVFEPETTNFSFKIVSDDGVSELRIYAEAVKK